MYYKIHSFNTDKNNYEDKDLGVRNDNVGIICLYYSCCFFVYKSHFKLDVYRHFNKRFNPH